MERDLTEVLDSCLAEIRAGRRTFAECLDAYPEHRADLEESLPLALAMAPPPLRIDPQRKLAARARFIEAIHESPPVPLWRQLFAVLGPGYGALRFGVASAFAALLTATLVVTAALASQDAKPGDVLYPVRIVIEDVQVAAAGPPEARVRTRVAIASQRLNEVEQAISRDDDATARRAAAGYEDALARAKAEIEQAKVNPEAVPELGQALQNNLRRQEIATARARERGDAGTAETLERAKERYVPQMQPMTLDRLAQGSATPTTAIAQLPAPTQNEAPVAAEVTVTPGEAPASPTAELPPASPSPGNGLTTPTPGSLRGVVSPATDIAQRPAEEPTSVAPSSRPFTPTPAIGVAGIPAPEPPPIVLGPPVPPRTGPTPPTTRDDDAARSAPTRAAAEPSPPAIAADPRVAPTPRQPASAADPQRPGDARPTPARPDDSDDGRTPSIALNPRPLLPPYVPPTTFGGPGGGAQPGQTAPVVPPASSAGGASTASVPSGTAGAAPASAPSVAAPAASAAAGGPSSAAPASAAFAPPATMTPTRSPTTTAVPPTPTPTNTAAPIGNGGKPPDNPGVSQSGSTGQGSNGVVSSPPGSGSGGAGTPPQPPSGAPR